MDELQQYNLAPSTYNPQQFREEQARALLSRIAPPMPQIPNMDMEARLNEFAVQARANVPAATPAAKPRKTLFDYWLDAGLAADQAGQHKFTPEVFNMLADRYKTEKLRPKLAQDKLTQEQADTVVTGFESKLEAYRRQLAPIFSKYQQQQQTQIPEGAEENSYGGELGANLVGGVGRAGTGIGNLADLAYRYARGATDYNLGNADTLSFGEQTGLGRASSAGDEAIGEFIRENTTAKSLEAQQEVDQAKGFWDTLGQYLQNPRLIGAMGAQGAGSLVPGVGAAGLVGRVGSVASKLGTAGRTAVVAAGAGLPAAGSQTAQTETRIQNAKLEDLLADNPMAQQMYAAISFAGVPEKDREKIFKQQLIDRANTIGLPANIAANVGTALIPGLGIERTVANKMLGKGITDAIVERTGGALAQFGIAGAKGAAKEGTQEGLAGVVSQVGENLGTGRPTTEGVGREAAANLLGGIAVGAPVEAAIGRQPTARGAKASDKLKKTATPVPEPVAAAQSAAVTAEAVTGLFEKPAEKPATPKVLETLTESLSTKLDTNADKLKRYVTNEKKIKNADDLINYVADRAQTFAGDNWDKLNNEQRLDAISTVLTGVRPNVPDLEGVDEAFSAFRGTALGTTAPPLVEQPLTQEDLPAQDDTARFQRPPVQQARPATEAPTTAKKNGKKVTEPVAKTEPVTKQVTPKQAEDRYYNSLFNYVNDNPVAVDPADRERILRNEPALDTLKAAVGKDFTDVGTMRGFLENRGITQDTTSPQSKGEFDNQVINKLLLNRKTNARPAREEATKLKKQALLLDMKADAVNKMTLLGLRESIRDLQDSGIEVPKVKKAKKNGKKVTVPAAEPSVESNVKPQRQEQGVEGMMVKDIESAPLSATTKLTKRNNDLKKAKQQVLQLISNVESIRKGSKSVGVKVRPSEELQEATLSQLRKYHDELTSEFDAKNKTRKAAEDKKETAQAATGKSVQIDRSLETALDEVAKLTREGTELAVDPLTEEQTNEIRTAVMAAARTGKVTSVREALTAANVFGPTIDTIVKSAKAAHDFELRRLKDAKTAEGKPLSKPVRSKILDAYLDYKEGNLSKTKFRTLVQDATQDVTGKGLDQELITQADEEKTRLASRLKELETKGRTPSPKASAPAKGAAKTRPLRKQTIKAQVSAAVKGADLADQDITAIEEAVAATREDVEGARGELDALLKDLELTPQQKTAVRKLTSEDTGARVSPTEADELANVDEENEEFLDRVMSQAELREQLRLYDDFPEALTVLERRRAEAIVQEFNEGNITAEEALAEQLESQSKVIGRVNRTDAQRGAKAVRARLLRERRAMTGSRRDAIDFALWLLNNNPNVANRVGVIIGDLGGKASGRYLPEQNIVAIASDEAGYGKSIIVHELMHHSERMLPPAVQYRMRLEYTARLKNKRQQAINNKDKVLQDFIELIQVNNANWTKEGRAKIVEFMRDNSEKLDFKDVYRYVDASEYWAESATDILARRYAGQDRWISRAKEWFAEYVERLKALVKWTNQNEVYKALREVMQGSGKAKSTTVLRQGPGELGGVETAETVTADTAVEQTSDEDGDNTEEDAIALQSNEEAEREKKAAASKVRESMKGVSWFQRAVENSANARIGFEEAEIEVIQSLLKSDPNAKIPFEESPQRNAYLYNGTVSRNNEIDTAEVVHGVNDYIERTWANHANSVGEFIDRLNDFFGATNLLERVETGWLHNVKLTQGKDGSRQDIFDAVSEGEMSGEEGLRKLKALVNKFASVPQEEYAQKFLGEDELAEYQATLERLATPEGGDISQKTMSELNTLMDSVRKRQRERLVESGLIDKNDPWIDFYGWKWYVPLKTAPSNSTSIVAQQMYDLIPREKLSLAKLNKQIKKMEGRKNDGERPFERLFVDLARAGERSAHGQFMRSLYDFVTSHQKQLGAYISVYKGRPFEGYTDKDGERHSTLPKPRGGRGFIYNNGNTHYVVTLPGNSQLLRALTLMNDIVRPSALSKTVAVGTNGLARLYTTLSPTWQFATGFVRELTTIPATVSVEQFEGPLQAATFNAAFIKNLALGSVAAKRTITAVTASERAFLDSLRASAESNANSEAAWTLRYLDNGGSNTFTKGFELGDKAKFTDSTQARMSALNTAEGFWENTKAAAGVAAIPLNKVAEITGNWAQFLELIPRTAAFRALVETQGMSDQEAAVAVRSILDYQQTGRYGRSVNSWFAFFRTAMTGLDTFRRIFRSRKTGKFDKAKFAKWQVTFAGMGMAYYALVAGLMGDDEEGEDKMKKMRASTLTRMLLIPTGDGDNKPLGVQIGMGVPQILLAPGILAAAAMNGHLTWAEASTELLATYQRNGPLANLGYTDQNPTSLMAGFLIGVSPTTIQPMIALDRNLDSFSREIHTGFGDDDKPRYLQGRASVSETFKDIAEFLYKTSDVVSGGNYHIDYYPEDIKYLISSYGGQNANDLVKMTAQKQGLENVGIVDDYNPVTGRFAVKDEAYHDQDFVYKLQGEARNITRRTAIIKADAEDKGESGGKAVNEFLKSHPNEAKVLNASKKLDKLMTKRSKAIREISRDKVMSVARKEARRKEVDRALREATQELRDALEQL